MAETQTPQEVTSQKPELNSILAKAQEAGHQQRVETVDTLKQGAAELKTSFINRAAQAREKATQAVNKTKELGKQWKNETMKYTEITMGIATNAEVRAALSNYLQEKVQDSKDALKTKSAEIRDGIIDNKDQAVLRFQEGMRGLWKKANEKLVQPQVTRAREIARNVKQGGENIKTYFQTQAENTRNRIRAKGAEVAASWNDILAKPRELRAGIVGGLGEKLVANANKDREGAQQRRTRATEHRAAASVLRTRAAPGGRT